MSSWLEWGDRVLCVVIFEWILGWRCCRVKKMEREDTLILKKKMYICIVSFGIFTFVSLEATLG